jgi:hypothetical protein
MSVDLSFLVVKHTEYYVYCCKTRPGKNTIIGESIMYCAASTGFHLETKFWVCKLIITPDMNNIKHFYFMSDSVRQSKITTKQNGTQKIRRKKEKKKIFNSQVNKRISHIVRVKA